MNCAQTTGAYRHDGPCEPIFVFGLDLDNVPVGDVFMVGKVVVNFIYDNTVPVNTMELMPANMEKPFIRFSSAPLVFSPFGSSAPKWHRY